MKKYYLKLENIIVIIQANKKYINTFYWYLSGLRIKYKVTLSVLGRIKQHFILLKFELKSYGLGKDKINLLKKVIAIVFFMVIKRS